MPPRKLKNTHPSTSDRALIGDWSHVRQADNGARTSRRSSHECALRNHVQLSSEWAGWWPQDDGTASLERRRPQRDTEWGIKARNKPGAVGGGVSASTTGGDHAGRASVRGGSGRLSRRRERFRAVCGDRCAHRKDRVFQFGSISCNIANTIFMGELSRATSWNRQLSLADAMEASLTVASAVQLHRNAGTRGEEWRHFEIQR